MPEYSTSHDKRRTKQLLGEGGAILAFWGAILLLELAQRAIDPRFGEPGRVTATEFWLALSEYGVWTIVTPFVFFLARRFSVEGVHLWRRLFLHLVLAFVVAVAVNALFHATLHALVVFDAPRRPFSLWRSVASLRFLDELIIYAAILAAGFARDYFIRYRRHLSESTTLKAEAAELNRELSEARLQALRMQINPHFLFNTLHAISNYVERDPRRVRQMIARLSELLRYSLDASSKPETPLHEELSFLDGYLEIQSIRFEDTLSVVRNIDPEVLDALVPTLILQPIVENAVKHGVETLEGSGRIDLSARRSGDKLLLVVRDNGPGLEASNGRSQSNSEGIGIRNTRARMKTLYGDAQSFRMEEPQGGGLEVTLELPYHTAADLFAAAV